MVMKPAWLEGLMGETFFVGCGSHENRRKNEKNIFCLDCCRSICPHCVSTHRSHPLLQVRRYVYHDVVRLDDLEKLIDCSYVQPYTINSAKVVFLNQRPQSRPCKGSANICFTCDRILQDPFRFCSLSCKVDHVVLQGGGDLTSILYRFDESDFAFSQFEGLRMDGSDVTEDDDIDDDQNTTPNSIHHHHHQYHHHHHHHHQYHQVVMHMDPHNHGHHFSKSKSMSASSCSSNISSSSHQHQQQQQQLGNSSSAAIIAGGGAAAAAGTTEVVVKRKKGTGFLPGIVLSLNSRRKGAPQRAPLS